METPQMPTCRRSWKIVASSWPLALGATGLWAQERVNRPLRLFGAQAVTQVAASPDGSRLAVVCGSSEVCGGERRHGKAGSPLRRGLFPSPTPGRKTLVTEGPTIRERTRRKSSCGMPPPERRSAPLTWERNRDCAANRVAFSPDGTRLAAGEASGMGESTGRLTLWDTASWAQTSTFPFSGGNLGPLLLRRWVPARRGLWGAPRRSSPSSGGR